MLPIRDLQKFWWKNLMFLLIGPEEPQQQEGAKVVGRASANRTTALYWLDPF